MAEIQFLPAQPFVAADITDPQWKDWLLQMWRAHQRNHTVTTSQTAAFFADMETYFYPCDTSGGAFAVTLPLAADCMGKMYEIFHSAGAGALTVSLSGSDAIAPTSAATIALNSTILLISDGVSNWYALAASTGGGSGGIIQSQLFTATGTFTPASGVSAVWVSGVGSGGGGSSRVALALGGGGGGAGESCENVMVPVTAGVGITVTIGAKGTGAGVGIVGQQPGVDGGDCTFGSLIILRGGKGALATGASGAGGGTGGAATAAASSPGTAGVNGVAETSVFFGGASGGSGASAFNVSGKGAASGGFLGGAAGATALGTTSSGAGGAATRWGAGANGGNGGVIGSSAAGTSYGAGGGGGGGNLTTTIGGGDGCAGCFLVVWIG